MNLWLSELTKNPFSVWQFLLINEMCLRNHIWTQANNLLYWMIIYQDGFTHSYYFKIESLLLTLENRCLQNNLPTKWIWQLFWNFSQISFSSTTALSVMQECILISTASKSAQKNIHFNIDNAVTSSLFPQAVRLLTSCSALNKEWFIN